MEPNDSSPDPLEIGSPSKCEKADRVAPDGFCFGSAASAHQSGPLGRRSARRITECAGKRRARYDTRNTRL
jgi:hypothetical protein